MKLQTVRLRQPIVTLSMVMGLVLPLLLSLSASAHVAVIPGEVPTSSFRTFSVGVPTEKEVSTTSIRLEIPKGLEHVMPNLKPGWDIDIEKQGEGEKASVVAITWSGGSIPAEFRDTFEFSAKTPDTPQKLEWKAIQTYEDGQEVSWTLDEAAQPKKADGSPDFSKSGPFSITQVVTENDAVASNTGESTSRSSQDSRRATILGIAGIVLGLAAIFIATRKQVPPAVK